MCVKASCLKKMCRGAAIICVWCECSCLCLCECLWFCNLCLCDLMCKHNAWRRYNTIKTTYEGAVKRSVNGSTCRRSASRVATCHRQWQISTSSCTHAHRHTRTHTNNRSTHTHLLVGHLQRETKLDGLALRILLSHFDEVDGDAVQKIFTVMNLREKQTGRRKEKSK